MKRYLIADSGGTKTDWCLVDEVGEKDFFSTESYHPENWNDDFFERNRLFFEDIEDKKKIDLYFFGSGCLNKEKCHLLYDFFTSFGFNSVTILSDLHSAAISALGNEDGQVAILGTGSVFFDWKEKEICHIVGGKGHLVGDEGSGYYFGKLILEAIKKNTLNEPQKKIVNERNLAQIELNAKFDVANISKQLKDVKTIFESFHIENITRFIISHQLEKRVNPIHVVGSYGFYHQAIIKHVFLQHGVQVLNFVKKPIADLVERRGVFID